MLPLSPFSICNGPWHPLNSTYVLDSPQQIPNITCMVKKGKTSPYSITEHRAPKLIPALGSQPAGDASHKTGGRLPLLSTRPAVTPATLKRVATNFAAW